ncbi:MAG: DUF1772 domain-containing protein [Bacteroidota bacterium]
MLFTIKSISLFSAILFTGLSAGLFYAWAVSVIPGTQRVSDASYLENMQQINRAILNPAFFAIFFGPLIALGMSTIQFSPAHLAFWLFLAATVCYLIGTFGITAFGNVPLNDQLEILELVDMEPSKAKNFRALYEHKWNRFHWLRTLAAIASFVLAILAAFLK